MSLCTLVQVKRLLGIGAADTEHDTLFGDLIAGVSAQLAVVTGRIAGGLPSMEKVTLAQLFSPPPRTHLLWLPAWPVASITEVKEALYDAGLQIPVSGFCICLGGREVHPDGIREIIDRASKGEKQTAYEYFRLKKELLPDLVPEV